MRTILLLALFGCVLLTTISANEDAHNESQEPQEDPEDNIDADENGADVESDIVEGDDSDDAAGNESDGDEDEEVVEEDANPKEE